MDSTSRLDLDALEQARRAVVQAREALRAVSANVTLCPTADLGAMAGEIADLRLATEAALVEVARDAIERGCPRDDGAPSTAVWLEQQSAGALRDRDARTIDAVATAITAPENHAVREAVRECRFGAETARAILTHHREITTSLPWTMHDDVLGQMIDLGAAGASLRELRRLRQWLIASYGNQGLLDKEQATLARKRGVTAFIEGEDGMFEARVRLDPASHAVVAAALDALAAPLTGVGDRGEPVRDERSPEQRRADAFVELCAAYPGLTGVGVRHTPRAKVVVTIDYDNLVARTGCGATLTGEQLSPSAVRELACDAGVIPVVLGGPSEAIDVGREERLATPAQVTALRHRDRGCTYPGCCRPPTWCKAHHIKHWADGGHTDLDNLALLCQHHHTYVHRHGLTATVGDAGVHWHIPARVLGPAAA